MFQAPHHGSKAANVPALAEWRGRAWRCRARGRRAGRAAFRSRTRPRGRSFLSTWADGAVTIRSHQTGIVVETFVTNQRFVLRTEPPE